MQAMAGENKRGQWKAAGECSRRPGWRPAALSLSVSALAVTAGADVCLASGMEAAAHAIGESLPVWTIIPFAGILLSIALCPLLTPRFWHHHFGKVSAF